MFFKFLMKIGRMVAEEADKEIYGPVAIKNQLAYYEEKLVNGEISEEEYEEFESELLDRLEQSLNNEDE